MVLTSVQPGYLAAAAHITHVAHVFALTVFILVLVWVLHFRGGAARLHSDDANLIFNVHPLVMSLGFILIIGEAIMAYKIVPADKMLQKFVHLLLHLIALGLGILGIYAAFKYHNAATLPDMVSLHSWLGMLTICLFGLQVTIKLKILICAVKFMNGIDGEGGDVAQWVFGFVNFWFPGASPAMRGLLVPVHKSAGLVVFLMTVCTAETGLVQMDAAPGAESRVINFTGLFMLLFAFAVSVSVALPKVF
ncbi:hypothetical protein ZIOFF_014093 [Zingiber officinale]|uniref:Cytochrome b561 domain-containing protein n=1 Tax=Zingiber officinale TaxID=94328 RepID=A0A8J5HGU6_ZINOF|nr:hypothetical protein ZIOFF_014093 [Zingiber officinale]